MNKKIMVQGRHLKYFFLLCALLIFSFALRFYTFWLPHWRGDQSHYISLAMKLDKLGLDGYNLRQVKIKFGNFKGDKQNQLVFPILAPPGDEGNLLRVLKNVGQAYYDEPLHMRAPLFPYALMFSHRLLAQKNQPYIVINSNLGGGVRESRPAKVFFAQFWAVLVPLFFNLTVIGITFALGRKIFDTRIGLYAAFLMAVNPLSIMLAHRILAEDMEVFFLCLSFLIFLKSYPSKRLWGAALSGACAGLAILTKQTAGLALFVVWIYVVFAKTSGGRGFKNLLKNLFPVEFLVYVFFAFLVSGFWFVKVTQVYGNPLHMPASGMSFAAQEDTTGWFRTMNRRPHPILFFSFGIMFLMPLFSLAFFTLQKFYNQIREFWFSGKPADASVFLWTWVIVFYLMVAQPWHILTTNFNQEHRYFYPAYPAIAILSAFMLEKIRLKIRASTVWPWAADVIVILLLWWNAQVGIQQAMEWVFGNVMLV